MDHSLLHIISHTDLDGIAAAAVAWHRWQPTRPLKVSLAGYGTVDALILESIEAGQEFVVIDLFCQNEEDNRKTGQTVYCRRRSVSLRPSRHHGRALRQPPLGRRGHHSLRGEGLLPLARRDGRAGMERLAPLVELANDRDLWINENPDSRLWQALITLCGPQSLFARLAANPEAVLLPHERAAAVEFVEKQEKRFALAVEKIGKSKDDLAFVEPGILEFGDVSDFGGLVLDRMANPPLLVAVAAKRYSGEWAVSMRSRSETAGKVVGMLRDGKKIRGAARRLRGALLPLPTLPSRSARRSRRPSGRSRTRSAPPA